MAKDSASWRRCYLHSARPALGECASCGKPICSECVTESGDARCCPPCKQKPAGKETIPSIPPSPIPRAPDSFRVGEVTIHSDGTVEAPETPPSGGPGPTPISETPGETAVRTASDGDIDGEAEPREHAEAEAGISRKNTSPDMDTGKPRIETSRLGRPAPLPKAAPVERSTQEPKVKPDSKKRADKVREKSATLGKRVGERVGQIAASNRTVRQLYYALPFALLAGVIIYAFWIFLAFLRRQWVQTSVLTAGIAVPWALYKGTTFKKRYGKPIYENSPKAIYMASASLLVMAILFICAQYAAFAVVYRGSDLANPFSLFLKANSSPLDIVQIVLGFLFSVSLPYWLKLGEGKHPKRSAGE